MENFEQEKDVDSQNDYRFPVGRLGGMFASVPETIAPLDPDDISKGVRHIISGEITGTEAQDSDTTQD